MSMFEPTKLDDLSRRVFWLMPGVCRDRAWRVFRPLSSRSAPELGSKQTLAATSALATQAMAKHYATMAVTQAGVGVSSQTRAALA